MLRSVNGEGSVVRARDVNAGSTMNVETSLFVARLTSDQASLGNRVHATCGRACVRAQVRTPSPMVRDGEMFLRIDGASA